jgi:hypothetical protein
MQISIKLKVVDIFSLISAISVVPTRKWWLCIFVYPKYAINQQFYEYKRLANESLIGIVRFSVHELVKLWGWRKKIKRMTAFDRKQILSSTTMVDIFTAV